jgi:hypothetical protein
MSSYIRREVLNKEPAASESSGRSSLAFRKRKALRSRLLDFVSATTSMVTVLAAGWFYIAGQSAAVRPVAVFETMVPAGMGAAIASLQAGGDQRATDVPSEVASPVEAPVNAAFEVLPREVETVRLRDLDQVAGTDMPAAGDQQSSSATGREPVAVDSEPLKAKSASLSPLDTGPVVPPDTGALVAQPEPLEAEAKAAPAVEDLLDRGNGLLGLGDVAAARLFYAMAAERGSAEGALLMGVTFDPVYFEHKGIHGTRPHVSEAVDWYERAAALGSLAAEQRKSTLASRLRLAAHDGDEGARHALKLFFEPAPQ